MAERGPAGVAPGGGPADEPAELLAARRRLAAAQDALLSSLVADGPPPAGFAPDRLAVQRRALVAKRAGVVARVAPELPEILGDAYRPAFAGYAARHPLTGGHRRDAVAFVRQLLAPEGNGAPALDPNVRRRLARWLGAEESPRRRPGPLRRAAEGLRPRRRRGEGDGR